MIELQIQEIREMREQAEYLKLYRFIEPISANQIPLFQAELDSATEWMKQQGDSVRILLVPEITENDAASYARTNANDTHKIIQEHAATASFFGQTAIHTTYMFEAGWIEVATYKMMEGIHLELLRKIADKVSIPTYHRRMARAGAAAFLLEQNASAFPEIWGIQKNIANYWIEWYLPYCEKIKDRDILINLQFFLKKIVDASTIAILFDMSPFIFSRVQTKNI